MHTVCWRVLEDKNDVEHSRIGLEGLNAEPSMFPSTEINKLVSMEITKMTTIKFTLVSICLLSPLLLLASGHGGEKRPFQKIKSELNNLTEIEVADASLVIVVEYIADRHSIPILFDETEVVKEGIDKEKTKITMSLSDITLESALNHILQPLSLDYIIKDEVLMITTNRVANKHKETVFYSLKGIEGTPEEFCKIVKKVISPESWGEPTKMLPGKTKKVKVPSTNLVKPLKDGMIVRQTQRNQRKIVKLLEQFQRYQKSNKTRRRDSSSSPAKKVPRTRKSNTSAIDNVRSKENKFNIAK